jgi:hypothetical protein
MLYDSSDKNLNLLLIDNEFELQELYYLYQCHLVSMLYCSYIKLTIDTELQDKNLNLLLIDNEFELQELHYLYQYYLVSMLRCSYIKLTLNRH